MFDKKSNTPLVLTIILCTLLISGSLIFLGLQLGKSGDPIAQTQNSRGDSLEEFIGQVEPSSDGDNAVLGNVDADVTLIEYSDYQCPFCRSFYENAYQQIKTEYIDKGLVKLIFRDFPLPFHGDAIYAGNAAKCAREVADDAAYYEFHDLLFEKQGTAAMGTVAITDKMIEEIAGELNLNSREFKKCTEDKSLYANVASDFLAASEMTADRIAQYNPETGGVEIVPIEEADRVGVNATPTVFVNDIKVVGAQSFEVFQAAIEAELNR